MWHFYIRQNNALFLKRCATRPWSYTWGLPGGRIEENQTPLEAMLREVVEETGMDISQEAISFLGKVYVRDPKKDFVYYMFKCDIFSKPNAIFLTDNERTEYRWLDSRDALEELPLVLGEGECIQLIYGDR